MNLPRVYMCSPERPNAGREITHRWSGRHHFSAMLFIWYPCYKQQSKSSLSQALRGFSLSEKSHLKTEIKEPAVMMGFPGDTVVKKKKKSACQCSRHRTCGFNPWAGKVHWSRKWQPTPAFLPGEFHGQRSLVHNVTKSQT